MTNRVLLTCYLYILAESISGQSCFNKGFPMYIKFDKTVWLTQGEFFGDSLYVGGSTWDEVRTQSYQKYSPFLMRIKTDSEIYWSKAITNFIGGSESIKVNNGMIYSILYTPYSQENYFLPLKKQSMVVIDNYVYITYTKIIQSLQYFKENLKEYQISIIRLTQNSNGFTSQEILTQIGQSKGSRAGGVIYSGNNLFFSGTVQFQQSQEISHYTMKFDKNFNFKKEDWNLIKGSTLSLQSLVLIYHEVFEPVQSDSNIQYMALQNDTQMLRRFIYLRVDGQSVAGYKHEIADKNTNLLAISQKGSNKFLLAIILCRRLVSENKSYIATLNFLTGELILIEHKQMSLKIALAAIISDKSNEPYIFLLGYAQSFSMDGQDTGIVSEITGKSPYCSQQQQELGHLTMMYQFKIQELLTIVFAQLILQIMMDTNQFLRQINKYQQPLFL
ncbi:UNKNOWN [Stylonychia lemnae]|uniref:Transmembrane protein n=1 Tax=Stylonychia lemnae TaxID=5949 RepID=A0A077ZQ08_STYLE|nr:UNKNOWN [Stylonychia lemnae]|eukprot:CDW71988.1 UNKNOWN [Stylonychia lemnae]